jgi:hypothetical protein
MFTAVYRKILRIVIEHRTRPLRSRMTCGTCCRQSGGDMIRVCAVLIIRLMTAVTVLLSVRKLRRVAFIAQQIGMRAGQGKRC